MNKQEYIQANRDWLKNKAQEEGVKALPKGMNIKSVVMMNIIMKKI